MREKMEREIIKICANKLRSALLEACLALENNQNTQMRLKLCSNNGVVQLMCISRAAEKLKIWSLLNEIYFKLTDAATVFSARCESQRQN